RKFRQLTLWDLAQPQETENSKVKELPCVIKNWRSNKSLNWEDQKMGKKLFDFCIGNPPYQGANDLNGRQPPVYHQFMDAAYQVAKCTELITPARFLFNAGQTPKEWNRKMLNDSHFKVIEYEPEASNLFPNTEIKGGVAITLFDVSKQFGAINIFTPYPELNSILHKVRPVEAKSLMSICVGAVPYHFTEKLSEEHPEYLNLIGKSFDLRTNILDKMCDKLFFDTKPKDGQDYVRIFGLHNKIRSSMWVKTQYINQAKNFNGYKVFIPKACGAGQFGESLPKLEIGEPEVGQTQSFISLGDLQSINEAKNLRKYLLCKFSRSLLGILKTTQDITPDKWKYVPIQDFTDRSDINWSKSVKEIDQQLYRKYGLNKAEIDFIESHVKEMS
ncbi:MAG: Eco57I restriction-modification methylase domain-containing protein, partial [Candidatus Cryptobacteroides sp.]|nr:Eco57I restriction-modification methylase domain-containing protein [Candidatus Cryptobacteroides sp.]